MWMVHGVKMPSIFGFFFSRVWKYFSVVKFHYTSTTCRWQFTFLSFVSFLVIVCSLFVSSTEDGTLTKFHLPFHYVTRRRRRHCLRLFLIFAKISEIIKQIEDLQRKHSLDRCGVLYDRMNPRPGMMLDNAGAEIRAEKKTAALKTSSLSIYFTFIFAF